MPAICRELGQDDNESDPTVPENAALRRADVAAGPSAKLVIDQDKIAELAKLNAVEYDRVRTKCAQELNVRTATLDKEVSKKRRTLGLETDNDEGQGRAVKIVDVTPWHEPVSGAQLAAALAAALKLYVILSEDARISVALWILHNWIVDKFTISPRLAVTSPTKGCGKTTVLRFLNMVARRPKRAGSISPPALFRVVEMFQPTILLDETEKYIEHGGDLHALLNEGHCKGGTVLRVLGDKLELREFSIYGAVAFARNGHLPDDLEQRSIVIEMQRRLASEELRELREDYCDDLKELARKCARWAQDVDIGDYNPDMGGLINRTADNWRPLFAIADTIGGEWPEHVRKAAKVLAPREATTYGVVLLADIRDLFTGRNTDRLSSGGIVAALHEMEGRPWVEWGKAKKPISKNQLAGLLKEFKVVPLTVRMGDETAKGYHLNQFADAFGRYLEPAKGHFGTSETSQRNKPTAASTFGTFQTVTRDSDVTVQKCKKPLRPSGCSVVTVRNADNAPTQEGIGLVCAQCGGGLETDPPADAPDMKVGDVWLHADCRRFWAPDLEIPGFLDRRAVSA